jgi:predicted DNA-binding transcriptional regulator AlpA
VLNLISSHWLSPPETSGFAPSLGAFFMTDEQRTVIPYGNRLPPEVRGRIIESLRYAMKQPMACLSASEVAVLLGITPNTLYVWEKQGLFPGPTFRGSGRNRSIKKYVVRDVVAWLKSHE